MVYLNENSEAAKNKHKVAEIDAEEPKVEKSNFEKWMQFLFP